MADDLLEVSVSMSLAVRSLLKLVYKTHFSFFKFIDARLVHVFLDVFTCLTNFVGASDDEFAIIELILIILPDLVSFDQLLKLD